MGKIFTIKVEHDFFNGQALVSVLYFHGGPFFHIQLIDPFLKEIFQLEHIRYKGRDGYRHCDLYSNDLSGILIDKIAQAIDQKLSGKTAIIRSLYCIKTNN